MAAGASVTTGAFVAGAVVAAEPPAAEPAVAWLVVVVLPPQAISRGTNSVTSSVRAKDVFRLMSYSSFEMTLRDNRSNPSLEGQI
ncbi:MAG: hypothetical protein NVSMB42_18600 [Herpetosiphon sp.]